MISADFSIRPAGAPSPLELANLPAPPVSHFSDSSIESKEEPDSLSLSDLPKLDRLILDSAPIPLIDLKDIQAARGELRAQLIEAFGNGLKEVGFIAIKADALTELVQDVNREMMLYFSQPVEEKMRDWHDNNGQTGFSPQGLETAAGAKVADLKETYFIPPNYTNWPKDRPEFQRVMEAYHRELTAVAAQLMTYIAEYLKEPTEDISTSMNAAGNLVRLAHYPAPKEGDHPLAVWAGAHEDLNALTLLPPSTVPGLQLLTKEGVWKSVTVPPGYLIVNTGEQLQSKTAGKIQATRHQVVNPGGEYAWQRRFASIFFASWSYDFSLRPFTSCVDAVTAHMVESQKEEYLMQFPDVTVQEHLLSRLIEMKTIKDPSEELVRSLREKGLLKQYIS